MELFLLPPRMREVERLLEARLQSGERPRDPEDTKLERAVEALIQVQRPALAKEDPDRYGARVREILGRAK